MNKAARAFIGRFNAGIKYKGLTCADRLMANKPAFQQNAHDILPLMLRAMRLWPAAFKMGDAI
jgi:hypothetical protein